MRLKELLQGVNHRMVGENVDITAIEYDSRKTKPGNLFCCIVGAVVDGHTFAQSAVDLGAAALVVERELPIAVPQVVVPDSRVAMAQIAANWYGHPERELTMVGVTGTNGKTTTTYMVKAIAEKAGKKVGLIGTIRNLIGSEPLETERTTPESVDLFRILRQMKDADVDIVVMEVSSHSLVQERVHGIMFDVAAFTNLTQDHLDYHKTLENYLQAKKRLFRQCRCAVVNVDDTYASRIMEGVEVPIVSFGVREPADVSASEIDITAKGVQFDMRTPAGKVHMHINIPGLFSVFNAMGAAAIALQLGCPMECVVEGLEEMEHVAGRLETIPVPDGRFSVIVDYAHTPDALENVLKTVQGFAPGRIVTVFGCGGDRDRAKRPVMGEIGGRFSDMLVVTSDNPRTEDPLKILEAIEEGVKKSGCEYVVIESRKEAIRYALEHAQDNDVVVIAGKGHESYQEINGVKYHFDDREIVAELLGESLR